MYACMSICVYAEHLCDDKVNTQRFIQSGRKLKFLRKKRPNRRSVGKEMERTEGTENYRNGNIRSSGEPEVGCSFNSSGTHGQRFLHHQLSQVKGVSPVRLHTWPGGDALPREKTPSPLFHLAVCS